MVAYLQGEADTHMVFMMVAAAKIGPTPMVLRGQTTIYASTFWN